MTQLTPAETWALVAIVAVCAFVLGFALSCLLSMGKLVEIDEERFVDDIINEGREG